MSSGEPGDRLGAARRAQPLGVWWVGVAGLVLSLLLLVGQNLRAYGVALGATLGVLALLRAALPARLTGGLSVRSRWVDVATLLALGVAVALLATNLRQV